MSRLIGGLVGLALLLEAASLVAQPLDDKLLDESAYRTDLEEIIIRGEAPRWRQQAVTETLRPEDIDFTEAAPNPRLDWLPNYSREDRERYQGVRDRKNETPELKLFEIHF